MSKTTNSFAPEGRARAVRMVGCTEAWRDTALKLHPPCREGITMALKHAAAGEVFHLTGIDDPAAQTVALARTSSFEAVHLVVRAGESLPAHKVDGSITLHCLEGHVALEGGKSSDMRAGDWLYLEPGTPHAVRGIADSALLLTILFDAPAFRADI